jgi:hypothetical protein
MCLLGKSFAGRREVGGANGKPFPLVLYKHANITNETYTSDKKKARKYK